MLGAMLDDGTFGAKLVSVYPDNFAQGGHSHQGVVVLFDPETGAPSAMLEAGEITAIRTAAASAAATDALAREDASRLAILGYGEQAWRHVEAIRMRPRRSIASRSGAARPTRRGPSPSASAATAAASVEEAVAGADIICTVTAAPEPILESRWVRGRRPCQRGRLEPRRPGRDRQRAGRPRPLLRRPSRRACSPRAPSSSAPARPG